MMVEQQSGGEVSQETHFGFPAKYRLRKPVEFQRVYQAKNRAGNHTLLVFGLPNGLEHSRIGLSVSRKHGNAVVRNRKKRLLREAFRLTRPQLPTGYDFILIPRFEFPGELEQYQNSLVHLTRKLARREESQ